MTMIIASAFVEAQEWFSERSETWQSPRMAVTVTTAFAVFSVSSSNLIAIAVGD